MRRRRAAACLLATTLVMTLAASSPAPPVPPPDAGAGATPMVVFGYNDLGMHCMNEDFSEIMILPPFNTLHAQVIDRSEREPKIVKSGVTVEYRIPGNTHSADKTNFWKYWQPVFGPPKPPNVGLTGNGLSGQMLPTGDNDWQVTGIPITPTDDAGRDNPYPLAVITVKRRGEVLATTQAVVPVSTEINCHLCHNTPGISPALDLLRAHDRRHGTNLEDEQPVLCAKCHADNALGLPGDPQLPNLSSAMHLAHAPRMGGLPFEEACYACHPGARTKCQRDVHFDRGIGCTDCHGDMEAVGDPNRNPWLDEPRCGDCHRRPGFEFEQPGTLYRNSVGHKKVHCAACHGSPHAITPTVTEVDNLQAQTLQGHPGVIDTCTVCHRDGPPGQFFHKVND
ncbi:MAG: hypothetical protein C4547_07490 [Phycisphaerales bacterium]|nr:MAG: hypothetical protein C4547_07490 [Phycisphaerales bacterium]